MVDREPKVKLEELAIPEGLVFQPQKWKVVSVVPGAVSRVENEKWSHQEGQLALLMPSKPGEGGLTIGFEMRLAQIENGEINSRGYGINLVSLGVEGFVVGLTHYPGIMPIDQEQHLSMYYKMGWGSKIRELRKSVDENRDVLTSSRPIQVEWEASAQEVAPVLARFLDYSDVHHVNVSSQ